MITWQSRLLAQLARYRRYPIEARRLHQQGTASVRIIIGGRGNVISARIEHSAGVPSLDAEALALIDRAQPLPPPPDATAQTTIELVVPLRFQLR